MKPMQVTDKDGNVYKSLTECAKKHSIKKSTFIKKINSGLTVDEIIEKFKKVQICDYQGNKFDSLNDMLKHYGIPLSIYTSRKRQGWDLKKILTTKVKSFTYEGVTYKSINDFCKRNKISTCHIKLLREILKI